MPSPTGSPALSRLGLCSVLLLGLVACSPGEPIEEPESLGAVAFANTCDATVQREIDRAVALLHHMTYPVAQTSFREVVERDPDCAVAYWGIAMTLFQPLWPTRPSESDLEDGHDLMLQARELVQPGSRESRFVAAGEAFFDPTGDPDYWARIDRWAQATTSAYEADPDDFEATAFFALAHLSTSARSQDPASQNARAAAVLSRILAEEPTHPGAVHYTIHANDFNGREGESLDVVRSYGAIAPRNPHALHMPTHIFVRLGEWPEVIDWNERAAEAALAQRVGASGEYVWDEFPHAVEYLVYAHLQTGDDAAARRLIQRLEDTPDLQPSFKTAFHLAPTPSRFALERQAWEEAVRIQPRQPDRLDWDRFPWPEALVWHARGLGAAHLGEGDLVDESLDKLTALSFSASDAGEALFARQIRILELEVQAWRAFEGGESVQAVAFLEEAVALEASTPKHPVTPGATLPASELLGDLYLAAGDPRSALAAFEESNGRAPGRLNTLLGLARSSLMLADSASAAAYYAEVLSRSSESSGRVGVAEARRGVPTASSFRHA